jgi:outer membrane protein TolC
VFSFRSILLALLAPLALSSARAEADTNRLDLAQAIDQAVRYNFDQMRRRLAASIPALQVELEMADFEWQVRPFFGVESSEKEVTLSRLGASLDRRHSAGGLFQARGEWVGRAEGDEDRFVDLSFDQPLFRRFGKTYAQRALESARFQARSAERSLESESAALILRVVDAFSGLVRQNDRVREEEEALVRAHELLRLLELRERQGRASRVEVMEMRMLHQETELRLRLARERGETLRLELAEWIGRVPEQMPALAEPAIPRLPERPLAHLQAMAWTNRVERHQALDAYEDARRRVRVEKRERYPDLRLLSRWRPVGSEDVGSWFVGVSGGRTLDLKTTDIRIRQEEQAARAALAEVAAVELRLNREVQAASSRCQAAAETLVLAEKQYALSLERLRLAGAYYRQGRADALQWRNAESSRVAAERDLADARAELLRGRYALLHAVGLLLGGS